MIIKRHEIVFTQSFNDAGSIVKSLEFNIHALGDDPDVVLGALKNLLRYFIRNPKMVKFCNRHHSESLVRELRDYNNNSRLISQCEHQTHQVLYAIELLLRKRPLYREHTQTFLNKLALNVKDLETLAEFNW